MSIKNKLQCIIKKSLPVDMDVNKIVIEIPKDKKNGDYSTNVAFLLTKELKSSPINIANDIIKNISDDMIDRIEVANPGFINFYIIYLIILMLLMIWERTMVRVILVN